MNDKTRQRQKRGREPDEKTVFVCGDVRCMLLATKLWHSIAKRCLATITIFSHLYWFTGSRLADQTSREMAVSIR